MDPNANTATENTRSDPVTGAPIVDNRDRAHVAANQTPDPIKPAGAAGGTIVGAADTLATEELRARPAPEDVARLKQDAERGDGGKPILTERDARADLAHQGTPATDSPQVTRGSPGGPPQPAAAAQRPTVVDQAGNARPDLTPPGGTAIPDPAGGQALAQPDQLARPAGGSTFTAPAPASARNGPIWRYVPEHGQGATVEVGMLDGMLALTINPDNGRSASIRLPASAAVALRAALAGVDLR